jgi:transcriptional regulator with XRE-family HTH domain
MRKRTITEADKRAATLLRSVWDRKKGELGLTQDKAADALDMTQGAVSHYLLGRIALGPVATLKFARLLGVAPKDIRPDFEFEILPGDMPTDVIEAAVKLASLPVDVRHDVSSLIDTLSKTGYAKLLENIQAHAHEARTIN